MTRRALVILVDGQEPPTVVNWDAHAPHAVQITAAADAVRLVEITDDDRLRAVRPADYTGDHDSAFSYPPLP